MFRFLKKLTTSSTIVLNDKGDVETSGADADALAVSMQLNKMILRLFGKYLASDGRSVNYDGIGSDRDYAEFEIVVGQLRAMRVSALPSDDQRLAFWINLYNILEIHARVYLRRIGEKGSAQKQRCAYQVGAYQLTLADIEHGILRCNRRPPYRPFARFRDGDARCALVMKELDARVHMALNCGANGCPPVRIFSAANIDYGLNAATRWFVNDDANVQIDERKAVVRVSKIFVWYDGDFGAREKFILKFLDDGEKKEALKRMMDKGSVKFSAMDYDWTENAGNERRDSDCDDDDAAAEQHMCERCGVGSAREQYAVKYKNRNDEEVKAVAWLCAKCADESDAKKQKKKKKSKKKQEKK